MKFKISMMGSGDNSAKEKIFEDMMGSEIDRMINSIDRKIFRVKNMYVTKMYLFQSTEMMLNKLGAMMEMSSKGQLDVEEMHQAVESEFYRQALVFYLINLGREIDENKIPIADMMMIQELEKYLSLQQMDLVGSIYKMD